MSVDPYVGRTLGPYLLEEVIGHGGMSVVYRARHEVLEQTRAVKLLSSHLAAQDGFVRLFYREARLAAGLRHPNIVLLYDVGDQDGLPYIVMELLPGRSLRDVIHDDQPLSIERVVHFIRQLADALDYAHAQGIAHRDVKPNNAFVRADDHLTLVDFGIARAANGTHITVTSGIGTPEYMAPETFDDALLRPAASEHEQAIDNDSYALGVVAYELLTGTQPFTGRNYSAVAYAHVHREPLPLQHYRADVPPAIETAVLRQLSKSPLQRLEPSAFAASLGRAARTHTQLGQIRAALNTDDLEGAADLLATLQQSDPDAPAAPLLNEVELRRERRDLKNQVKRHLASGNWKGALEAVGALELRGAPDVQTLRSQVESVRRTREAAAPAERPAAPPSPVATTPTERASTPSVSPSKSPARPVGVPPLGPSGAAPGVTPPLPPPPATRPLRSTLTPPPRTAIPPSPAGVQRASPSRWAGGGVAALALVAIAGWWLMRPSTPAPTSVAALPTTTQASILTVPTATRPVVSATTGPVAAAPVATATPARAAPTAPAPTAGPSAEQRLADALARVDRGDFDGASQTIEALRGSSPAPAGLDEARYDLAIRFGQQLLTQKQLDASFAKFGEALSIRPGDAAAKAGQTQVVLVKLWDQMEASWNSDPDAALRAAEDVFQTDPNYREIRQKLYAILVAKADRQLTSGERQEAAASLSRAVDVNPDGQEARRALVALTPTPIPVQAPPTARPIAPTPVPYRPPAQQAQPAQPAPAQPAVQPTRAPRTSGSPT